MPIVANCPGAPQLIAQIPKVETNEKVAEQGVVIHAALETNQFDDLGLTEKGIALRLREMTEQALADWIAFIAIDGVPTIVREQRLWMRDQDTLRPIGSAKIDFGAFLDEQALVLDYKSGFIMPTSAEKNWQMKMQAICAWHESKKQLKHIRVGIAFSRLYDKLDLADYDEEALIAAEWEIMRALEKAKEEGAPRFPGSHCRYCPARAGGFCREYAAWATIDTIPFAGISDKVDLAIAISKLSPQALAQIHAKKAVIELLLDGVTARLRSMTPEQLSEVGLKKKDGNNVRIVKDKAKLFSLLTEGDSPLLTKDQLLEHVTISVGSIDDIVSTLNPSLPSKAIPAKTEELFGPALDKRENQPSIKKL